MKLRSSGQSTQDADVPTVVRRAISRGAGFTKKRIPTSDTLGTKLRKARKRLGVELRTAEAATRVAMKHLEALEQGHYHQLPAKVYVRGFLTRYAGFLDLNAEKVLNDYEAEEACYKQVRHVRSSKPSEEGLLRPHVTDDWLKRNRQWYVTPEVIWGGSLSIVLVGILGYIWFQVASFAAAPPLDIVTPGSDVVTVAQVEVAGVTDPSAELKINDQPVAVDRDGHFRQAVHLVDGVNTIAISAMSKASKETVKTIQLLANVAQPTPPPSQPAPTN